MAVGIRLEAQGGEEFKKTLGEAAQAEEEFIAETKKTAEVLTSEWSRAFQSFRAIGESTQTALANIQAAQEQGIKPAQIIRQNLDLLFEAEQRVVSAGGDWVELERQKAEWSGKRAEQLRQEQESLRSAAQAEEAFASRVQLILQIGQQFGATSKEIQESLMGVGLSAKEATAAMEAMGIEVDGLNNKFVRSRDAAGEIGKVFFGLTLLSFGLLSIQKQLRESGDTDLLPVVEKWTSFFQTVSAFGAAGAFSGLGAAGAIGGGIIGALIELPNLLDRTTEATKDLIQQMDALSRKSDAADTLQRIGNVSAQTAEDLIKAAQAGGEFSQRFSRDLENLARAQKEVENAPASPGRGGGRAAEGVAARNQEIEQQREAAQASLEAARAAVQLDVEILKINQHYADSISTLQKWTQTGDDVVSVLNEITGATSEDVDAIQAALKVHPEWGVALRDNIENIANLTKGLKDAPQYADEYTQALEAQTQAATQNAQALAAQGRVIQELQPVVEMLSKLGTSPDKTLGGLAGVDQETIDRFKQFAEANRDVAEQASKLVAQIETEKAQLAGLEARGQGASDAANRLRDSIEAQESSLHSLITTHQDFSDILKDVADAQEKLNKALADAAFREDQLNQRVQNQRDQAQQQYSNAVEDAAQQRANAIFNSEQSLTNKLEDLWQNLQNSVSDINQQLADKISDINMQLANRIADIQQALQDKINSIQQDLQNKLADLAHQRDQQIAQANEKEAQAAQDLARKLYEIERDRIEATQALSFNTAEQLRNAQTDHDREAVLRRHLFEQAQIDQTANDKRNDAQNDFQQKVQEAEKEKQLAQENYEYEVRLARELARQKIAEAQHAAEVQIQQAQRQAAQQLAIAQREHDQALAAAQRRYEQEREDAERTAAQQVAAALKAEREKVADAQRALEQRNAAITASAELERQQIEKTKQDAINAYDAVNKKLMELLTTIRNFIAESLVAIGVAAAFAKELANLTLLENYIAGYQGPGNPIGEGNLPPLPGGANGLDMIVPNEARYANDGFLVRASAGERVTIQQPNTFNTSSQSQNVTINVYDATDPKRVANVVRTELANLSWN